MRRQQKQSENAKRWGGDDYEEIFKEMTYILNDKEEVEFNQERASVW